MSILQISAPKSGSYWLHTILREILQKKNLPITSFIQQQEVYQKAKNLDLSFEGQADVDMMDIEEDGCYYRISSVFREKIEDPATYIKSNSIVWTHSTFCNTSLEVLPLFDKKICIIRDPRDRALSSAKFAFTPYMQKYYPTSHSSPHDYLDKEYSRLIDQWVWFVGNYLLYKEKLNIHFVFYENLLLNFDHELQSILNYLHIDLDKKAQQEIFDAVSFSTMKEKSPGHLQKGKFGKWVQQLSESQKETAIKQAGFLLTILNYPLHIKNGVLPSVPEKIPQKKLKQSLQQIEWEGLF